MVQLLLGVQNFDTADASDGLALAICHAHTARLGMGNPSASRELSAGTRSALQVAIENASGGRGKKRISLAEAVGVVPSGIRRVGAPKR
jgi:hypothetical protein